ncbi:MAG: DUF1833 family protein [Treponema sp.]|nr:DUF1833 family protein [Treponema sp.]
MRLSPSATDAVLAPETQEVFLHLVKIETSGGAILRFVDNTQNIISQDEEYIAASFTVILPEQTENAPRPCRLAIDNTDLAVFQTIKQSVNEEIIVTICVIAASTPNVYERGPLRYRLRNIRASKETIEGEVYDFYLIDRKFPKDTYTPDNFEGLYF